MRPDPPCAPCTNPGACEGKSCFKIAIRAVGHKGGDDGDEEDEEEDDQEDHQDPGSDDS